MTIAGITYRVAHLPMILDAVYPVSSLRRHRHLSKLRPLSSKLKHSVCNGCDLKQSGRPHMKLPYTLSLSVCLVRQNGEPKNISVSVFHAVFDEWLRLLL